MQLKIEIKGQEYNLGLSWGLGCFEIASKHLNVDTVDEVMFEAVKDSSTMARVAYSAIQNFVEIENETDEVPFSYRQFQAWLSEQPDALGRDIVKDFENSFYNGKTMKSYYDELSAAIKQIRGEELPDEKENKPKPKKKVALAK